MINILKKTLLIEKIVLGGIILLGFMDPSIWLWGILFIGIPLILFTLIMSIILYARGSTTAPYTKQSLFQIIALHIGLIVIIWTFITVIAHDFWGGFM